MMNLPQLLIVSHAEACYRADGFTQEERMDKKSTMVYKMLSERNYGA
jgi:hypothetical protein